MQNTSSKPCFFNLLILGGTAFLSLATISSPALQAQESKPPASASAAQTSASGFKLRSQSNVVVVRVVVRDAKGRAVSGLRKQDFRIRDNDQLQVISGFSVERPAAVPAAELQAASSPAAPTGYLAFYFDDLYSSTDSIVRAREAAEEFIAALPRAHGLQSSPHPARRLWTLPTTGRSSTKR